MYIIHTDRIRVANFQSRRWVRRSSEIQRQLLQGNSSLSTLSEVSSRELSTLIDAKLKDGLNPEALTQEISDAVSQGYTHVSQLVAVSGQALYKELTSFQIIARALAE
jgi:hypothetical protein